MTPGAALRALHAAGRIATPYLRGMTWRPTKMSVYGAGLILRTGSAPDYAPQREPDLTDAATVGCLAALAREGAVDPSLAAMPFEWPTVMWAVSGYANPQRREAEYPARPSEGEAWAAALVALAGGAP